MKSNNIILYILAFGLFVLNACTANLDPLSKVDIGPDKGLPKVSISSPVNGSTIQSISNPASVKFAYTAKDSTQITSVSVMVDGKVVSGYEIPKDYMDESRTFTQTITIDTNQHTFRVIATDKGGHKDTATSTFRVKYSPVPSSYTPFTGEVFYMPFDGYSKELVSLKDATVNNTVNYGDGKFGNGSFKGNTSGYFTASTPSALTASKEFTFSFFYYYTATPERQGILTVSPKPIEAGKNNLNYGFRLFREGPGTIKCNIGNGTGSMWADNSTSLTPYTGQWIHIAGVTFEKKFKLYINGVEKMSVDLSSPINWTGSDIIDIGAGGDRFPEWGHKAGNDMMDELRFFSKALAPEQVQDLMVNKAPRIITPSLTYNATFVTGASIQVSLNGTTSSANPTFKLTNGFYPFSASFPSNEVKAYSGLLKINGADQTVTFPTSTTASQLKDSVFHGASIQSAFSIVGNPAAYLDGSKLAYSGGSPGSGGYLGAKFSDVLSVNDTNVSFSFWYKLSASAERAGIVTIAAPDPDSASKGGKQNNRTYGIRLFREGGATGKIKLNVGDGSAESWIDGASLAGMDTVWSQITVTIGGGKAIIYVNGVNVKQGNTRLSWQNCDLMTIGSGGPRFNETGWDHKEDPSGIKNFKLYKSNLDATTVLNNYNAEK